MLPDTVERGEERSWYSNGGSPEEALTNWARSSADFKPNPRKSNAPCWFIKLSIDCRFASPQEDRFRSAIAGVNNSGSEPPVGGGSILTISPFETLTD